MGSLSPGWHRYECDSAHLSAYHLPMGSLSPAQHWNECDSAHLLNEMLQLNLSWCESVQRLQRYGFRKVRTDGRTDGRMHAHTHERTNRCWVFYSPPSGFFELAGDNYANYAGKFSRFFEFFPKITNCVAFCAPFSPKSARGCWILQFRLYPFSPL